MRDTRNIDTYKVAGNGDPKSIAIVITMHGIGDDIFAMPAIKAKRDEGYEITVFCKPFSRKVWQSLGCKVYPSVTEDKGASNITQSNFIGYDFDGAWQVFSLKERFGMIYDLAQWSDWTLKDGSIANYKSRIHVFAELIETTAPKSFSWIDYLQPRYDVRLSDRIIFAPDSASKDRCLTKQKRLYRKLKSIGNVILFGQSVMYHHKTLPRKARFGKKDYFRLGFFQAWKFLRDSFLKIRFFNFDRKKFLCKNFDELISYVYSAKLIIATDNGIAQIARAFGKDCIEIFGETREITASQFDEFHKANYEVVRGEVLAEGIDYSDHEHFILERTKQWQQHIMA